MKGIIRGLTVVVLLAGLVLFTPASPAGAAGVVGTGNPASCTEAALDAALAGGGFVNFNCGGAHTISITSEKTISVNTQINGSGLITLDGGGTTRVFVVNHGVSLSLSNITLSNGFHDEEGGAILNDGGTVTVSNSSFMNNFADDAGGAIANIGGSLSVTSSQFEGNSAVFGGGISSANESIAITATIAAEIDDGIAVDASASLEELAEQAAATAQNLSVVSAELGNSTTAAEMIMTTLMIDSSVFSGNNDVDFGGGVMSLDGTTSITNSTFSDNFDVVFGGGVTSFGGSTTITSSTFSGNNDVDFGGGVASIGGTTSITTSTFSGNFDVAFGGGAMTLGGTTTLATSTFSGNYDIAFGGGVASLGGTATLEFSTVNGNIVGAGGGGVLTLGGTMNITNSTLSGNSAAFGGGVSTLAGRTNITNSTLSTNSAGSGGGIHNDDDDTTILGSIVADNNASSGANCVLEDPLTSLGYNLSDDATCTFTEPTDLENTAAGLAPLGNYGGPTQTHHPFAGSAAVDSSSCFTPTDQRGVVRPQGLDCDRGSVEIVPPADLTTLCVNFYTGEVTSPLNGQCGTGLFQINLPSPWPLNFCVNPYSGELQLLFGQPCNPPRMSHIIPNDGEMIVCWSRYTGELRYVTDQLFCSFQAETPARIAAGI